MDTTQQRSSSNRPSRAEILLRTAELFALRGTCLRPNNGAVIARDGHILATGYSGSPPGADHCLDKGCIIGPDGGCIRTTHAELNAILQAAKLGISIAGANMYCTTSPCITCAKAIIGSGIIEVYFRTTYRDQSGLLLLRESGLFVARLGSDDRTFRE